jgi:hypothetical protein
MEEVWHFLTNASTWRRIRTEKIKFLIDKLDSFYVFGLSQHF